ncbi:hypothetical protein HMI56_006177 [Coelomomyces lativittatus]|nr:hypothetical protein HMI56_006177 [Coelomomyces lativittatus]
MSLASKLTFLGSIVFASATVLGVHLQQKFERDPFFHRKAALASSQSHWKPCLQALTDYLTYFPLDKDVWFKVATLYLDVGMYQPALWCYEEMLMLGPTPQLWMYLGEVYYTLHQYKKAMTCFLYGLQMQSNLRGYYAVVQCMKQLGWPIPSGLKQQCLKVYYKSSSSSTCTFQVAIKYFDGATDPNARVEKK